jgi:hypothetical protein
MTSVTSNADDKNMGRWTLWLTIIILAAFFAFYCLALLSGIFSSPDDYSGVEKVTSTLGPIAAAVIGYYFGQRPVGTLADKLQDTAGSATQSVQKYDNVYERILKENEKLNETISRQEQIIARNEQSIEILKQIINDWREGKLVKEGEPKK